MAVGTTLVSVVSTACGAGEPTLVFANFESYLAPQLRNSLYTDARIAPIQFDYYQTNEDMMANFRNGTYSVGVPSLYTVVTLIRERLLAELDWSTFGLEGINNATDALQLFIDPVKNALQAYDVDGDGQADNLLRWCVPYFFQSYVFAYRGPEIASLATSTNSTNPSLETIIRAIANDQRFKDGHFGAVEDQRVLFSLSRILQTENDAASVTVNPQSSIQDPTINDYVSVFNELATTGLNKTTLGNKPTPIFLNSDSSVILNKLAAPARADGQYPLAGALMFNGDAIFAAQGGEFHAEDQPPTGNDFHIVTPQYMPIALDAMVLSQKAATNPTLKNHAYALMSRVALEGAKGTVTQMEEETTTDDGETEYVMGPMINFDYVQYVSPLKIISAPAPTQNNGQTNAQDTTATSVVSGGYFAAPEGADEAANKLATTIQNAYNIKVPDNTIKRLQEDPVNAWQKQAITNAYLRFKATNWS